MHCTVPVGGVRQYLHNLYKDGKDPEISINEGGVGDYIDKVGDCRPLHMYIPTWPFHGISAWATFT